MPSVDEVLQLFEQRGHSQYGGEAVSQLEHALQSAFLAEQEGAPAALIVAALLHDLGHLLHDLPDDAPERGIDDDHETIASNYLKPLYPESVTDPLRLHVAAKRYLCAVDSGYQQSLSEPSRISLTLQGGPMTAAEVARFRQSPHWEDAVRLRRWDDAAKVPGLVTPPLSHFAAHCAVAAEGNGE